MAASVAMTMAPGSEAPSEPEGQASGRDARKERVRLRASTLRALVSAGVCNQQSAGQLSRELLDAAIAARQQGCSSVLELQAALEREEQPRSVRAWLRARDCPDRPEYLEQMLARLAQLYEPRPVPHYLDKYEYVSVMLALIEQSAEILDWHVLFCVQLSKLCRTTRDLVLPWLAQRQDVCISLAQEYFVGLQPDPVFAGVCGRMLALGGSRPKRFWCSFGARLASYSS